MKKYLKGITAIAILFSVVACNKTKTTSNRFMDGGEWNVTELSVGGVNEEELPTWEVEECDLYNESCFAEWKNEEGGHAEFVWQFREKANTFEISHQAKEEEHEGEEEHAHADEEVAEQAYNFSGVYSVSEKSKTAMEFTTTSAAGFAGSSVKIKIEKK
ncbi:MAG: hypothetical protein ACI8ZM_004138 [Crocinitomix sp.]|jgi:hypothetical protein